MIALAVVADLSYEEARSLLRKVGREYGHGVGMAQIRAALSRLGFRIVEQNPVEFIRIHYPSHCQETFKSMTTHHPDRFPEVWDRIDRGILDLPDHVSGIRNGVLHDWTRSRRFRVNRLFVVLRNESREARKVFPSNEGPTILTQGAKRPKPGE